MTFPQAVRGVYQGEEVILRFALPGVKPGSNFLKGRVLDGGEAHLIIYGPDIPGGMAVVNPAWLYQVDAEPRGDGCQGLSGKENELDRPWLEGL